MGRIFEELKRRNVIRVAVAYVVSGWLVLQVADLVLENIDAPAWVMKVFLLIGALGFPLVLTFSWAYELTPEGLKREKDVDRSQSITSHTGRKLNYVTIGMVVAVLGVTILDRTIPSNSAADNPAESPAAEKSIAVLAFEDLSPDGDQAYFAQGLSEELLNVLAKVTDLQVAGRTSSFAFQGQQKDLREIGELLNVAHILEGSVRKSGNRIRVTAQLIKTSDGFHLFSETYDKELSDIFAVQDEIAQSISNALLSEIIGTESVAGAKVTDTEAYELYLHAKQRIYTRDLADMREAANMLDRALEIDPIYAPALAQKALVTYLTSDALGAYGDVPFAEAWPVSKRLVDQALALDEQLAEAHAINGLLLDNSGSRDEAISELRLAVKLNPSMTSAANWLASALGSVGESQEARTILEAAVKRDPIFLPTFNNLIGDYARTGDHDLADNLLSRVSRVVGENHSVRMAQGITSVMRGEPAQAVRALQSAHEENPNSSVLQMWYGFALLDLADFDTLRDIGLPEHRIIALSAQGDVEEAYRVLENFDVNSSFPPRVLGDIGYFFNSRERSGEFVEYLVDNYGSLETLLRTQSVEQGWGTGYLGELVYAYLQLGDEQAVTELLEIMQRRLEDVPKEGSDNWVIRINEAQYAALTGDTESALSALQRAVDDGFKNVDGIDSHMFASLRDDPKFAELRQTLAERVDAERASLGMPPYRPIAATDAPKNRPTFVN